MAGKWSVTVANLTVDELISEMKSYSVNGIINENVDTPPSLHSLLLASSPATMELDLPEYTDDPYLLGSIINELPGRVEVIEDGKTLSLSQPLAEGRHDLSIQRVTEDGRVSKITRFYHVVDTLAPEIILGDFEHQTYFPHVLLKFTLSEYVKDFYINNKLFGFGTGSQTDIVHAVDLEMGINYFKLRAVDHLGRETVITTTVTREGEIPEYVQMDGYVMHYYFDEEGRFMAERTHGEDLSFLFE